MLLNHHQKLTVILVLTLQLWNESAALSYIRSDRSIPHTSVRFTAPLLEEGFPPAVNEYKSGENKKKPLLLYLPGAYNIYIKSDLYMPTLFSHSSYKHIMYTFVILI